MSGKKGKSGRPRLELKNVQLTGSVPEEVSEAIRQAAIINERSPNAFVGKLILQGWGIFQEEEE
jgi:hypothetical protein